MLGNFFKKPHQDAKVFSPDLYLNYVLAEYANQKF